MHDKSVASVFQDVINREPVFDESVFALAYFNAVKIVFGNSIDALEYQLSVAVVIVIKFKIFNVIEIFTLQLFRFSDIAGKVKVREQICPHKVKFRIAGNDGVDRLAESVKTDSVEIRIFAVRYI